MVSGVDCGVIRTSDTDGSSIVLIRHPATVNSNATSSALISIVKDLGGLNYHKLKVSIFVSKLGGDRTRPNDMVLPRTPRRAKEPAKYLAHIGEKGRYVVVGKGKQILLQQWLQLSYVVLANLRSRRTGITLRPTARDENGLESIDGLFSSPEKSPIKKTGGKQASSSDGESMDIGQSKDILSCSAGAATISNEL